MSCAQKISPRIHHSFVHDGPKAMGGWGIMPRDAINIMLSTALRTKMVIYVIMSDVYACIRKLTGRKKKVPTFWVAEITFNTGDAETTIVGILYLGNNGSNIYKSIFPMERKKT